MQLIIKEKENKNFHSTVKPVALMEYLIKMVTPKGGIVLDPFAGSGSTLVAAKQNGYQYIGCELTEEYIPIIEARLNAVEETKEKQTSLF
jgi:site-specific DNA-methyltransferase (adenine-specific)